MAGSVTELAAIYRWPESRGDRTASLSDLQRHYRQLREQPLLDSIAAAASLSIVHTDRIDLSNVTPQMAEAFSLAYPDVELASLVDRTPSEVAGFLAAWKGKYFEVLVRDRLNSGEWVGDIHLAPGQKAVLAESASQPGWDLRILDADGLVAELQLKATSSLGYVERALNKYPEIQVISTDEVASAALGSGLNVLPSGIRDLNLESSITQPMESLMDSPIGNVTEGLLPILPVVLILTTEAAPVVMGQRSFRLACRSGLIRFTKLGVSLAAGWVVYMADGGVGSIVVTAVTRMLLGRTEGNARLEKTLTVASDELRQLRGSPPLLTAG